jgi:hypothetical protein
MIIERETRLEVATRILSAMLATQKHEDNSGAVFEHHDDYIGSRIDEALRWADALIAKVNA